MSQPRSLVVGLAFLGFVSLGLPDGLLGVAWPSIRASFDRPIDALGQIILSFTIGYLVASFNLGRVLTRIQIGTLLTLSCLATASSLLGFALTQSWWVLVGLSCLLGAGGGAIDAGMNTYVARHFSVRTLNWLHACYGLGAVLGPLVVTGVLSHGLAWQWSYAAVSAAQFLLALCFGLTRRWWALPAASAGERTGRVSAPATASETLRLPVAWLGIMLFFVYVGVEVTAGQWSYSLFTEARGVPIVTAGLWISVYWGSLMAGRTLIGAFSNAIAPELLVRTCISTVMIAAALVWLNPGGFGAFAGLALAGFAFAPVFPTLIALTPKRVGARHAANSIGFQVGAGGLGGALVPFTVGLLAGQMGLEVVGPALLASVSLLLILALLIERLTLRSRGLSSGDRRTPGR